MSHVLVPIALNFRLRGWSFVLLLGVLAAGVMLAAEVDARGSQKLSQDTCAVIVVTGMRLQEDAAGSNKDLAVAEGAVVRVQAKDGAVREKTTTPFNGSGTRAGFFSADFVVDLDATYEVEMTFRNGTTIKIDDFRLPREWRTHFYFHSTRGTKSPASVLRVGRDESSGLSCYIYAVFPMESYRALGGRQEGK